MSGYTGRWSVDIVEEPSQYDPTRTVATIHMWPVDDGFGHELRSGASLHDERVTACGWESLACACTPSIETEPGCSTVRHRPLLGARCQQRALQRQQAFYEPGALDAAP